MDRSKDALLDCHERSKRRLDFYAPAGPASMPSRPYGSVPTSDACTRRLTHDARTADRPQTSSRCKRRDRSGPSRSVSLAQFYPDSGGASQSMTKPGLWREHVDERLPEMGKKREGRAARTGGGTRDRRWHALGSPGAAEKPCPFVESRYTQAAYFRCKETSGHGFSAEPIAYV